MTCNIYCLIIPSSFLLVVALKGLKIEKKCSKSEIKTENATKIMDQIFFTRFGFHNIASVFCLVEARFKKSAQIAN